MSPIDFITIWRANPFRPLRLRTKDGRDIYILTQHQVAMSVTMQTIVIVMTNETIERLTPDDIVSCTPVDASAARNDRPDETQPQAPPPAAAPFSYKQLLDPGGVRFLSFTATDGRALTHVAVTSKSGEPMLSTLGTRWDCHGIESFENGHSLFLHHADDPLLQRRVIVWPPKKATLNSFSEADTPSAIEAILREEDAKAQAKPQGFLPAKGYTGTFPPLEEYRPRSDKRYFKGEEEGEEDFSRFTIETGSTPLASDDEARPPRITDARTKTVMFDLFDTLWDGSISSGGGLFKADLVFAAHSEWKLSLLIDPFAATARLDGPVQDGAAQSIPLSAAAAALRNFTMHFSFEALLSHLAFACPTNQPSIELNSRDGFQIELWPGDPRTRTPFLQPRILNPAGRAILDLRGTDWGTQIRTNSKGPSLTMCLFHKDPSDRDMSSPRWLMLDLPSQRFSNDLGKVRNDFVAGTACLARLQIIALTCRSTRQLWSELHEEFKRGQMLAPTP